MGNARRIICIGNRYVERDAAGAKVHDRLRDRGVPEGIDLIDGGLKGLDLLRFVEGAGRVVFVDAVEGYLPRKGVVVLDAKEIIDVSGRRFDHAAGLGYLLSALPAACGGALPEIAVVGVQGETDGTLIEEAAVRSLELVTGAQ
jgi:hydrogenase maturation protease